MSKRIKFKTELKPAEVENRLRAMFESRVSVMKRLEATIDPENETFVGTVSSASFSGERVVSRRFLSPVIKGSILGDGDATTIAVELSPPPRIALAAAIVGFASLMALVLIGLGLLSDALILCVGMVAVCGYLYLTYDGELERVETAIRKQLTV